MSNITISKQEYNRLHKRAAAYEKLAGYLFQNMLKDSVEEVVADFRKTKLYEEEFLNDLEEGLKDSSYFTKKHAHTATLKQSTAAYKKLSVSKKVGKSKKAL